MNKYVIAVVAALNFVAASSSHAAGPVVVDIKAFVFAPQEVTVTRGTTVTWINHDQDVHSVKSNGGKFGSSGLDSEDRYTFTFDTPGDFAYVCGLHPHMTGVIHVRDP
jgi:plastocyanin